MVGLVRWCRNGLCGMWDFLAIAGVQRAGARRAAEVRRPVRNQFEPHTHGR